jgi:uncharacterized protein (TIRG00374 family)
MRTRGGLWVALLWLGALALLAWALKRLSLAEVAAVIGRLMAGQLAALALVNAGILWLFGARWRVILGALGHPIPYRAIFRYRLAAFGVSYFTPGPHFGGEPLQVYYVHKNHGVPLAEATAAIGMDKLFELAVNFTFLLAGVGVVAASGVMSGTGLARAVPAVTLLLAVPLAYFGALWRGRQPLTRLLARPAARRVGRAAAFVQETEGQMAAFSREQPRAMLAALAISGIVWAALLSEFWLMLTVLGVKVDMVGLVTMMTAARLALLTPFPGALGVLEAGQLLASAALGYSAGTGAAISLLIRGRDVLFGLAGLAWGGLLLPKFAPRKPKLE